MGSFLCLKFGRDAMAIIVGCFLVIDLTWFILQSWGIYFLIFLNSRISLSIKGLSYLVTVPNLRIGAVVDNN